jgi:hypothetical protein
VSQNELNAKVRRLEERVEHLEHFIMESLVFRVEDLAELVDESMGSIPRSRSREIAGHARHVADKARVSGWKDDGP